MTIRLDRRLALAGLPALAAVPAILGGAAAQTAPAPAPAPAAQAPGFYRFKLGGMTVTTVHDGFRDLPVQGFVRNAPLEDVQRVLAESFLSTTTYRIPFTVTFVETPRGLVVFDAGNGVTPAGATMGRMMENMRAAGLDPAAVQTVIHSHFHGDHVNGLLDAQGARAFPNAEIVVPAAEWAWWSDTGNESRTPEGQRPTFANAARRFAPYNGRVRQVADGAEVVPGIRAVAAYGHTPGHTVYHLADGGAEMMFVADTINRPELFARRPDFHAVFDFDAPMAEASRRRIFDRVSADRIRITGYHFPFPANGYLAKDGNGYRFIPADWSSAV
ncbi:MBL fold metallo-hydrolase [Paracraurococcus ruber]|uniref:MBL fold metallo-hydrolase n=1 Tax=Paracraurococcus ruber TaxID=77675 RepID=A0ABS1CWN7_9PROT|nr:MBL fold metallo-hydrolase [Paracraurococcus ruber]MBK1658656.1 MBL fold metallo-hydrolase [Paracraurococcus ruber]TDG29607.1 MBL fold metallo-hydrolase [Paracraurococcus ruber]